MEKKTPRSPGWDNNTFRELFQCCVWIGESLRLDFQLGGTRSWESYHFWGTRHHAADRNPLENSITASGFFDWKEAQWPLLVGLLLIAAFLAQPPRRYGRGLEESNPSFAFEKARSNRRGVVMHSQLMVGRQHERKKIADFSRVNSQRRRYDGVGVIEMRESMADRVAKVSLVLHEGTSYPLHQPMLSS